MSGRFFGGYYSNHDIVADYTLSPFELYLRVMRKCGHENAEFVRNMLRFLGDFVIPFDTSGCEPEEQNNSPPDERTYWAYSANPISTSNRSFGSDPRLDHLDYNAYNALPPKKKLASTQFLARVRSLNWEKF
ncbi:hypothetical protein BDZ45DRAFT_751122 [Acephala macrosclerotiorum]|nr:hypothetical protein BDZ45DRAFT_751122 [Acephala macrosclerotiorum]